MTLYFAYGSNMSRAGMAARCPAARTLGVAKLPGWRFIIAIDGYASIAPAPSGEVIGLLWRLSPRDVAALNAYESLDSGLYRRRQVTVHHEGAARSAMVYIARGEGGGRARPGYMESVIEAAREWKLPPGYVRALQRWLPAARRPARVAMPGADA